MCLHPWLGLIFHQFDESNSKLQGQVIIDADEDDVILGKQAGTKNRSVEKEIQ